MQVFLRLSLALCFLFASVSPSFAAQRTFAITPFEVQGAKAFNYLEKAVPPMLASRLYWKDAIEPISDTEAAKLSYPSNEQAVEGLLASTGADYLIWGSIVIVNNEASLDVRARSSSGEEWRKGFQTHVNELIPTLQVASDSINTEVFGRNTSTSASTTQQPINRMNPDLVHNETTQAGVYLNPQFRYQGADGARLRSQSMPFVASGIAVADVTGDGNNDVVLLEESAVHVYSWQNGQLMPISSFDLPNNYEALRVRTIDLNRDGAEELIVAMADPEESIGMSFILDARGGEIREVLRERKVFLSVTRLLPDMMPRLIGQRSDHQRIFSRSGVFEMEKQGNSLVQGAPLNLPSKANVFNFAWLPGSENESEKLIVLSGDERLLTFSSKGDEMAESDETYSGSATYINEQTNLPGLGRVTDDIFNQYFIPMNMEVTDLDANGTWELLVNKPVSIAAMFFERYRFFPEGEIQSLTWDGIGLSLLWKTRRIKGSVADFTVSDINNDGITDLIVCVNTHPGALNLKSRKSMVIVYPLDTSKTDPNTPIHVSR